LGRSVAQGSGCSPAGDPGCCVTQELGRSVVQALGRSMAQRSGCSLAGGLGCCVTQELGRSVARGANRSSAQGSGVSSFPQAAGGPWPGAGTGYPPLAVVVTDGAASGDQSTGFPHPVQCPGAPVSVYPQFVQNRMRVPCLHQCVTPDAAMVVIFMPFVIPNGPPSDCRNHKLGGSHQEGQRPPGSARPCS
jgi:hypothetical protein